MKWLVGCVISIISFIVFTKTQSIINTTHNFTILVFLAKSQRPNEQLILSMYKYVNI